MNTLDVLLKAAQLIENPARWTQRALARDHEGRPVSYPINYKHGGIPTCWCAIGALWHVLPLKVEHHNARAKARTALNAASEQLCGVRLTSWVNDYHGHLMVRRVYRQAIANERQKQRKTEWDEKEEQWKR